MSAAGASDRSLSLSSGSRSFTETVFATGELCPLTGLDTGEADIVTEDGKAACCETTMSVMILSMERHVARGHLGDTAGDPRVSQIAWEQLKNSYFPSLSHCPDVLDGDEADGR